MQQEASINKQISLLEEKREAYIKAQEEQEKTSKTALDSVLETYYDKEKEDYEHTLRAVQENIQQDIEN